MIVLPHFLFYRHHIDISLKVAPEGLNITKVIYGYNTFGGFGGPGDQETGLNIYRLPNEITEQIEEKGIDFLNNLPLNNLSDSWHKTPIHNTDGSIASFSLSGSLMSIFGDSKAYEKAIKEAGNPIVGQDKVNQLIQATGNFYYQTMNGGIVLIAPKKNGLFFIINPTR